MQIKDVCKLTGLTPRTIRFYIEKGLIAPKIKPKNTNEYREYSDDDVRQLINISYLRKLLFSIQDIKEMMEKPDLIGTIVEEHKMEIENETQTHKDILDCLYGLDMASISSVEELAGKLQKSAENLPLPMGDIKPNFGKFDTETPEEKEDAYLDFKVHQRIREKVNEFLKPIKRAALIASLIALIVFAVILVSGIPRKIDKQYPAIQYRYNDPEYMVETSMTIKGKLYTRLFSDPKFVGSLVIDGFGYTREYDLCDIVLSMKIRKGYGALIYSSISNGMPILETLGAIWIEGNFDKTTIWAFEPLDADSKSSTDLIISAPAGTREEAVEITDKLSNYGDYHKSSGE